MTANDALKRQSSPLTPQTKRRASQADFTRVMDGVHRRIGLAVKEYVTTDKGATNFARKMASILEDRYARASQLGRNRAGDFTGKNKLDKELAQAVMREQEPYLQGFLADLLSGKYEQDGYPNVRAIQNRAEAYAARVRGVANEAFVSASMMYTFVWKLGGAEKHCRRCPDLAKGSPYTALDLPTVPGAGATDCVYRCTCYLERSDGVKGFQ